MRRRNREQGITFTDILQTLPLIFGGYVLLDAWIAADAEQLHTTFCLLLQLISQKEIRIEIAPQIILGLLISAPAAVWLLTRIQIYWETGE